MHLVVSISHWPCNKLPDLSRVGTLPSPKDSWDWLHLRLPTLRSGKKPLSIHPFARGGLLPIFGFHCNAGHIAKRLSSQFEGLLDSREDRDESALMPHS